MSDESFEYLVQGYRRFYHKYLGDHYEEYRQEATVRQAPKVMMIACSDSRVSPSIVTHSKLGEVFIVCNVANIVPPYRPDKGTHHSTSSALEFAVGTLDVEHIIVMGHSGCGGIRALLDGAPVALDGEYSFIKPWVEIIAEAKTKVCHLHKDEQYQACEQEALKISMENLRTFPWIEKRITEKTLAIHGWHFDIASGVMTAYDKTKDQFVTLLDNSI